MFRMRPYHQAMMWKEVVSESSPKRLAAQGLFITCSRWGNLRACWMEQASGVGDTT
jgi:hypothetical protein